MDAHATDREEEQDLTDFAEDYEQDLEETEEVLDA